MKKVSFQILLCAFKINNDVKESEAVVRRCSVNKIFLEISQNSQENTCARAWPGTLLKKRLWHRYFPVNFCEISENTFFHRTTLVALLFWRTHLLKNVSSKQSKKMKLKILSMNGRKGKVCGMFALPSR